MRVLHCCLAAFYIDNYGYQENILPKMHKLQGHEVAILASTETYVNNKALAYVKPDNYINENDIPVTRIPYVKYLPDPLARKLRIYKGVWKILEHFKPQIIFIHDCQFISIKDIARYVKNNSEVKVYVDGHTDHINSGKNWLSMNILHKVIYKWCASTIEPYTRKFYGTLPLRVDFYKSVYRVPAEKVELLELGVDDTVVDSDEIDIIRTSVRNRVGVNADELVIVTGGKIDRRKNIHILMKVVSGMKDKKVSILVFGVPDEEMVGEIEVLSKNINIHYLGWANYYETHGYLLAGDIAFFPGTHSVLWEQSIGLGLPCVFKRWQGMEHLDIGGNCLFLEEASENEIKETIHLMKNNKQLYQDMKKAAQSKGKKVFSYYQIAKRAIEAD